MDLERLVKEAKPSAPKIEIQLCGQIDVVQHPMVPGGRVITLYHAPSETVYLIPLDLSGARVVAAKLGSANGQAVS
jgi:hypothetical protein